MAPRSIRGATCNTAPSATDRADRASYLSCLSCYRIRDAIRDNARMTANSETNPYLTKSGLEF
jgi:hypothetical protein